ncbi:MAG: T9SS type A sorting domain-containing protein [Bacteroidota bacterium]
MDRIATSGGDYIEYLPAPLKWLPGGQTISKDAAFYSTNLEDIRMREVFNRGGSLEPEKSLREVLNYWAASPEGKYFRIFSANITKDISVTYKNDFAGTTGNGKMLFLDLTEPPSGVPVLDEPGGETDVPAGGLVVKYFCGDRQLVMAKEEQVVAGNKYKFGGWTVFGSPRSEIRQDLTIRQDGNVTAHYTSSIENIIQVNLIGDGETLNAYLKVGDTVKSVNGTTAFKHYSSNPTLEAYPTLVSYGVVYQFSHWNTGSTSTTITTSPNGSYTAYYNFNYLRPPSSLRIISMPGDPGLDLRWNEMLSPYITLLELWSKTKSTSYQLLETLPATATRYIDSRYSISTVSQENNIGLEYQLKAKYVKPGVRTVWAQSGVFAWVSDDGVLPFERTNEEMSSITLKNDFGAYPNPFNPSTRISYQLPEIAHVVLELYDITGRRIAELLNSEMPPGYHSVAWDGTGKASGVYLYRFTAQVEGKQDVFLRTGKLILTK